MEKFYGLHKDTIIRMRDEFAKTLTDTIRDNIQYPKDPHMYKRCRMLCLAIQELTEELEFRNDEIIDNFPMPKISLSHTDINPETDAPETEHALS